MEYKTEEVDRFEPNRTLVNLTHVKFIHSGDVWSLVNSNGVEIACGIGADVCLNPDAETIKDDEEIAKQENPWQAESVDAAELQSILVDKFMGNRPEYPHGLFKWAHNVIKMLNGE